MRIMALDVGDKTIGVAVTDPMGWSAQGVGTVRRAGFKKDVEAVSTYVKEYEVETLIVGLPLRGDGEAGIQAKKVLGFMESLKRELAPLFPVLKFETWDESMTTAEAHELLAGAKVSTKKRKKVVDKLAAVFILESYLRKGD